MLVSTPNIEMWNQRVKALPAPSPSSESETEELTLGHAFPFFTKAQTCMEKSLHIEIPVHFWGYI